MKRESKSYLYQFLKNFMLTLFVPVLTIFLLYLQAEHVVKNQILVSSRNTLNQFFRLVDAAAEEMKEICITAAGDTECQSFARYSAYQEEKTVWQSYQVKQVLSNLMGSKYYDICVYYPNEDRIISGKNASLSADYYFATYYKRQESSLKYYEEFRELLSCESKRPSFFCLNVDEENSFLCVAMKQLNYRDPTLNYVVILILDPQYVDQLMKGQSTGQEGIILMFDGNKELLLAGDREAINYTLEGYAGTTAVYKDSFNGHSYMMQVQESGAMDAYYAFATPVVYFWRQLFRLRVICGMGGIVCILISVTVAYRGAKRSYRPIGNMVNKLQKQVRIIYDETADTEFEFIEALFEKGSEERLQLNKRLKKGEDVRLERFLLSLLTGNVSANTFGDNIFIQNGIPLCSDYFLVGVLLTERGEEPAALEAEEAMESFVVGNVFKELCNREYRGYLTALAGDRYAILLNPGGNVKEEEIAELLEEGKLFLEQYYHIRMTVGISRIHEGMREVPTAYQEALLALKYRYLLGLNRVICYSEICGREFQYSSAAESRLTRMVMGYIRETAAASSAASFVADIMDLYEINESVSMETVECFRFEVVNAMNKAIMSGGYSAGSRKDIITELMNAPTLEQLQASLEQQLTRLHEKAEEWLKNEDVCRKAYRYIEEQYADAELSVAGLGEQLHISPSYLSRLFKERYGINIPDCISRIRVQNSKADLRGSRKNMQEIAGQNGFLSSNVYIKTFKKWEGITPGVYRKLAQQESTGG